MSVSGNVKKETCLIERGDDEAFQINHTTADV